MAAPRQKTVRDTITGNTIGIADLALLHHLHNPSDTTAELQAAPGHAVTVEALVSLE